MAYATKRQTSNGIVPLGSNLFGVCTTGASAQTKVVTMSDFDVLVEGVTIHVYFQYDNQASNPLLQVGSTTAKAIRYNGVSDGQWKAGGFFSFTYYQGFWVMNDVQEGGSGETYTFSISGHTLTITDSHGNTQTLTLPDDDTKYGLSISGDTISLVENGGSSSITINDDNTTYTVSISGNTITLTGSDGSTSSVTVPDTNTTYALSKVGSSVLLTGSDGSTTSVTDSDTTYSLSITGHTIVLTSSTGILDSVTVPDDDTTYTLSISGHTLTLTPSSGTAQSVTLPDDDTTYTITNSGSTITLTPSLGTPQSITVPNDNTTYTFSVSGHTLTITPSSGATQTVTLPDDDTTYSLSISGHILTLTPSSGAAQTITLPDDDTTYSLSISGNSLTLTGSDGSTSTVTIPTLIDMFYPVGSYYETSDTTFDPNVTWGGTWLLDSAGMVTVSADANDTDFDTVGNTGGSKDIQEHSHGFTQPKIPNHTHNIKVASPNNTGTLSTSQVQYGKPTGTNYTNDNAFSSSGGGGACTGGAVGGVQTTSHTTMATGNSGNLQPYIVVNRWHRTA